MHDVQNDALPRGMNLFLPCLAILLFTAVAWAQVTTATIYGTVTDPTGGVVPGATITMVAEATGAASSKVSGAAGEFVFDFLHVGTYTLRIEGAGFKKYQVTGLQLDAAQNLRRVFTLELGAVA